MKITKTLVGLMCLASAFATTSCLNSSEQDLQTTGTFSGFINVMFDGVSANPLYRSGVSYSANYNLTKATCDLSVTGLTTASGAVPTFEIKDLPVTSNEKGWMNISAALAAPTSPLAPTLMNLRFNVIDRYVNVGGSAVGSALSQVSYSFDNYSVVSLPTAVLNQGTTETTAEDGTVYTSKGAEDGMTYMISLVKSGSTSSTIDFNNADNRKAYIRIYSAKFLDSMPAMNMQFDDIPFNIGSDGRITMSIAELTPQTVAINGTTATTTPFESAKITNLNCVTDAANNMVLTFTCTMSLPTFQGVYNVKAICTEP